MTKAKTFIAELQGLLGQIKMRRRNIAVFSFLSVVTVLGAQFGLRIVRRPMETQSVSASASASVLAKLAGISGETSKGYTSGRIYSVDGEAVSGEFYSPDGWAKHCALPGYNLLGSSGSGGAITAWDDVLRSSACPENRALREGDSIQLTLHSKAQQKAAKQLAQCFPDTVCDGAALAVVTKTGAVLVAAGNNLCTQEDYFQDSAIARIHTDLSAEPYAIGSTAKIMAARVLLLHEDELPAEWRLSNERFEDVSYFSPAPNITIHNHDAGNPAAYTNTVSDPFTRLLSFFDAMRESSNTYILRHILTLGGGSPQRAFEYMDTCYGLTQPMQTELGNLEAITCPDDRLYWFFWGGDFKTSVVRQCELVNHSLSGEAYSAFYVSRVYLPDAAHTVLYEADPQPKKSLSFSIEEDDPLKPALANCFESYNIAPSVTAPYAAYIAQHRLLSKSGTADTNESESLLDASRTLSVLDENGNLICTASILVHNIHSSSVDNNVLYSILLDTLTEAGILKPIYTEGEGRS